MRQPPRRLLLANSLVDRAEFTSVRRLDSNPFFDDDGEDLFPRHMAMMIMEAKIARIKRCVSMLPVYADCDLPESIMRDLMRSSMVNTVFNNPNIVGPRGLLPQ